MVGRLQKVAASFALVSVFSGAALASAPNGLAPAEPAILDIARADSLGRWSLIASASRKAWQEEPFASRFEGQGIFRGPATAQASDGESRRASVSFDWQRWIPAGSLRAGAFAAARELAVNSGSFGADDSTLWERVGQRDRGTRIGGHATWQGFGLATRLRAQGESVVSEGRLDRSSGETPRLYLDERLRQSFAGIGLSTDARPAPGLRATAALGVDRYRFDVASTRGLASATAAGNLLAPRMEIVATRRGGAEYFASFGRGTGSSYERGPTVALDPRNGAPLAHLDPAATAILAEAGWRTSWSGVETRVSGWRARTGGELLLLGKEGVLATDRRALRTGFTLSMRRQPARWLSLDLDASAIDARYRDGAREKVRGSAGHQVNAGATVRNGSKWSASLFVKYLGARPAIEENALRLRSSTTVGAQFTTRVSKATRITVDVFNVFNQRAGDIDYFAASRLWSQPGTVDGYLFHPAAPRGFRALVSTRF